MAIGKRTNTKQHFEDHLNENFSDTLTQKQAVKKFVHLSSKKNKTIIIKNHTNRILGTFLRKNDKTQFDVMYQEFCKQYN